MTTHLRHLVLASLLAATGLLRCARPTDLPDERTASDFADLYVASPERGGDDTNPGDRSTAPLATLAAAVARAATLAPGGEAPIEIAVVQGTYAETLVLADGASLALRGGYDNVDPYLWTRPGDAAETTIAGVMGTAILVPASATVTLERLTLIGGPGVPDEAQIVDDELDLALFGAGGLAVIGGEATATDCVLDGGPGALGEARAGVVADQGGTVVIEESTLRGGDNASFPSGLFCGRRSTCTLRRCPEVAGGIARRNVIERDLDQSTGVAGLASTRIALEDNESIAGSEGYLSAGVWSWRVAALEVRNNAAIHGTSAVEASMGLLVMHTPDLSIVGNGTITAGAADASIGAQLNACQGEVRDNLFVEGGQAHQFSAGLVLAEGTVIEVLTNVTIAGGEGFRSVGLLLSDAAAKVRANGINGGLAHLAATGVSLSGVRPDGAGFETLLAGNNVYAGTSSDTVVGLNVEAGSPLVLNNVFIAGAGLSAAYGVLLNGDGAPALAFNTVAVLTPIQAADAETYAAGLADATTDSQVIGNLVVTNEWTDSTLLWFPLGADVHGTYLQNALFHWPVGARGDTTAYLALVGEVDAPDTTSLDYPRGGDQGALLELNAQSGISRTFSCNPAWGAPGLGQGASYDVHLGLSGCRDKGPDVLEFAAGARDRGHDIQAEGFKDFEGDPRPQGEANEPGADEIAID